MKLPDKRLCRSFVNFLYLRRLLNGKNRLALIISGSFLIILWQSTFILYHESLSNKYRITASSGMHDEARFVYFSYYLGLYPVATEIENPPLSKEGAMQILTHRGETLRTEWGHTTRYGDLGKGLLFLPWAYLKGTPEKPSVMPFHAFMFIVALLALFVSFCYVSQVGLGIFVILFLGSNPFQLFEVYGNKNIFGWPITTAMFILAIHIPLFARPRLKLIFLWLAPALTGLILSAVRQIRPESVAIILSAVLCYVFIPKRGWIKRMALIGTVGLTFFLSSYGWHSYFDQKIKQADATVIAAGGTPFTGPRDIYHMVWHNVWCGLGDFDEKYGYKWDDRSAARYAFPILKEKYHVELPQWDYKAWICDRDFWDRSGKYYKTPYEVPHYQEVLRDRVVHDITSDPLWYLRIIGRRIYYLLYRNVPACLSIGRWQIGIPMPCFLLFPMVAVLIYTRSWKLLGILCFTLSLASTSIAVYALRGTTYYACFNLFVAAIFFTWVMEGFLRCCRKLKTKYRLI